MKHSKHSGQISVEYTVIVFALLIALFVPYGDDDKSAVVRFLDAVRVMYEQSSFMVSLP